MRLNKIFTYLFFCILLLFSCESNSERAIIKEDIVDEIIDENIKILSLRDSYTNLNYKSLYKSI